jgi:hypothetical protein
VSYLLTENIEWLFCHEQVDDKVIDGIESQLNVKFPEDYIDCAKINHGGNPSLQVYDFPEHYEAVFNSLLSLSPDESSYIVDVYNNVKKRLVDNIIPFADDPFGNLICFDYRNGTDNVSIVFWDHELSYEDSQKALTPICATFTSLLLCLRAE